MSLDKLNCPRCSVVLSPLKQELKTASSFSCCLRRCEKCGIGFSNAKNNPTIIYGDYHHNIPELLRLDLDHTLNNALNQVNRENKKLKFAFSTSEDALTWSFFKYFVNNGRVKDLLKLLNIEISESSFEIYLWGANVSSKTINTNFYQQLICTSDKFNEDKFRRSEPDVIIKLSDKLIFIEVKYRSSNDIKSDTSKFNKYMDPKIDSTKSSDSGHYELFRNWAFARSLSDGKDFELINLGLNKLFTDKNELRLNQFEDSLNTLNGKFTRLSWEDILNRMVLSTYDEWFISYLKNKIFL